MKLIIFQLNSNQRENLILKSSYMSFKLIYEFYALILFSVQWWCRIDAEASYKFYFLTDDITRLYANGLHAGVCEWKGLSQASSGQFLLVY